MKRHLASAAFGLALLVGPAEADYAPLLTTEMIGSADLIVVGNIQRVDHDTFTLRVERQLYGSTAQPGPLVVRRFKNWPCAHRWAEYQAGQRLILFLGAEPSAGSGWRILGAGDEGEMLVEGGTVYYRLVPDPSQRNQAHPVTGGQFYGVSAQFGEVIDALSEYRSIWRLLTEESGWGRDVVLVGSQEAATVFSRRSSFHNHLAVQSSRFTEAARDRW